jgi:hypothetical protein
MGTSPGSNRFLAECKSPHVWRYTLLLGLPVGLLLATINQGDHWWRHEVNTVVLAKSILSPLLSCSIAFISAVAARSAKHSKPTSE